MRVKSLVPFRKSSAGCCVQEEYGHAVMLAVFDTVDDTTLVSKALISVSWILPLVVLYVIVCVTGGPRAGKILLWVKKLYHFNWKTDCQGHARRVIQRSISLWAHQHPASQTSWWRHRCHQSKLWCERQHLNYFTSSPLHRQYRVLALLDLSSVLAVIMGKGITSPLLSYVACVTALVLGCVGKRSR